MAVNNAPVVEARVRRLAGWIRDHYEGQQAAFAAATQTNEGELSRILNGKKSFGEKKALKLERTLGMPDGYLVNPLAASQPVGIVPSMLAESIAALRRVAASRGWEYDPETHPVVTVTCYELRAQLPEKPPKAVLIDFGKKVAERLERAVEGRDGSDQGGPVGASNRVGADHQAAPEPKVAGGGKRKSA